MSLACKAPKICCCHWAGMVSIRLARPPILDNKTRAEVCWGGGRFLGKMFLLPKKSCKKELAPLFFLWTLSCLGVMMGTAGGILQPARGWGCTARRAGSAEDRGSEQPYLCVPSSISCRSSGSGWGFLSLAGKSTVRNKILVNIIISSSNIWEIPMRFSVSL